MKGQRRTNLITKMIPTLKSLFPNVFSILSHPAYWDSLCLYIFYDLVFLIYHESYDNYNPYIMFTCYFKTNKKPLGANAIKNSEYHSYATLIH